jgi:hypothetical protein
VKQKGILVCVGILFVVWEVYSHSGFANLYCQVFARLVPAPSFFNRHALYMDWRSACVRNWRQLPKGGRDISTPAVCDPLSVWSCCPYNLLACCVCHSYIMLKFALFWKLRWGKWVRETIEWSGMAELKFCAAVFRWLLFTYPVSLLCLFLHIPKSLCNVEGCWLQNICRQVRALKIDVSLCKVWSIIFVIDVTCITCFRVIPCM